MERDEGMNGPHPVAIKFTDKRKSYHINTLTRPAVEFLSEIYS